jgi:protein SCO1
MTPRRRTIPSLLAYVVVGVLVALSMFGIAGFLWLGANRVGAIGGPFALENTDGQMVTNATYRGKYMLVYFGYTYCPDVCPTTLQALANALDLLGPKVNEVAPVFITVDPARDTPTVMKRYTAAFSSRVIGLTGTAAEIAAVAREYHVYYAKHVTGPGPDDYAMEHSSVIYLMGRDGRFIAPIPEGSPRQMAADMARLIR